MKLSKRVKVLFGVSLTILVATLCGISLWPFTAGIREKWASERRNAQWHAERARKIKNGEVPRQWQWAARPPVKGPVKLALSEITPLEMPDPSLEARARAWPAFTHAPFDKSGFNAVSLPFRFGSTDGSGDPSVANAFAFLLSHDLDWSPGCYTARHAYFVFKRSRDEVLPMLDGYEGDTVANLVRDWGGTHAIGGILVQSPKGFSATLQIFGRGGNVVYEKELAEPRPYFQLLGDVTIEAMRFFGDSPSAALTKHLHRPRCQREESLVKLGKAAFLEQWSDEDSEAYAGILSADPEFAEVRQWWANQKWWRDQDRGAYEYQKALSLQSAVTAIALEDFDPDQCPDPELAARYPQWVRRAEEFVGPDAPLIQTLKLRQTSKAILPDLALVAGAIKTAGRFPNYGNLPVEVIELYKPWQSRARFANGLTYDADLLGSLCVAYMRCGFQPGAGKSFMYSWFADVALTAGRHGEAAWALSVVVEEAQNRRGARTQLDDTHAVSYGDALMDMGRFDEAIAAYRPVLSSASAHRDQVVRAGAAIIFAAGVTGNVRVLDEMLRELAITKAELRPFAEAARKLAMGNDVDEAEIGKLPIPAWAGFWRGRLSIQLDLLQFNSDQRCRQRFQELLRPGARLDMILMDRYERLPLPSGLPADVQPQPLAGFYESLEWLYPDDPWAVQAVADWRKRGGTPRFPDAAKLLAILRKRENPTIIDVPPFSVVASVRGLVESGQRDVATALATEYRNRCDKGNGLTEALGNHLLFRIEQSR